MGTLKTKGKPTVNRREKDLPTKRTTDVTGGLRGRYQVRLEPTHEISHSEGTR